MEVCQSRRRKGAQQIVFVIAFITLAVLMLALWYGAVSGMFEAKVSQLTTLFGKYP